MTDDVRDIVNDPLVGLAKEKKNKLTMKREVVYYTTDGQKFTDKSAAVVAQRYLNVETLVKELGSYGNITYLEIVDNWDLFQDAMNIH